MPGTTRCPRHEVLIHPFRLADRLVTNGEWLAFMDDGGYRHGLAVAGRRLGPVNREGWQARSTGSSVTGEWLAMSLEGLQPVDRAAPVCSRQLLRGRRLRPLGRQAAADRIRMGGRGAGPSRRPATRWQRARCVRCLPTARPDGKPRQMFGDVWEWTQSAYLPYPGYRPPAGALGEYNGKFMVSQQVLRGGSCATPDGHTRATYRNFFYPHQRWQFTGLRLASEIE